MRRCGLDTVNVVVRKGYWTEPENLARTLPEYIRVMETELGRRPHLATMALPATELTARPHLIETLAEHGIREFRMGYFRRQAGEDVATAVSRSRRELEALLRVCEGCDVKVIYQVHHGTLFSNSWAVWQLVKGFNPRHVGVMLDPGNQFMEGWENWSDAFSRLKGYLCALGIKDAWMQRRPDDENLRTGNKGWYKELGVPIDEGCVNWGDLLRVLKTYEFRGTFVFMPFYEKEDSERHCTVLQREVQYMRRLLKEMEAAG
ncbi:MAG: hypothetical protein D6820_06220 [Lentisphaerae bacterium]|nr:MAG: hypothetical protein D6820_06220 [Lentisphaerota bacterium]